MTNYDLLDFLGEVREEYVWEAVQGKFSGEKPGRARSRSKLLLIAAVAALILAGCAAVWLRLQDLSIGQEAYTESYNAQGLAIEPTEGTRDILTWGGHHGDSMQLALKEWYGFLETYDADGSLKAQFPGAENMDFPAQYYHTYRCYTREMADKLTEIAQKHKLKLLGSPLSIQSYQEKLFWESTGLDSLLAAEGNVEVRNFSGIVYPPGNFSLDLQLHREGTVLYAQYSYFSKDYLHNRLWDKLDFARVSQWNHTTGDGTRVLLALSDKGKGFILAEKDDAAILIEIDGNLSTSHYPQPEDIITKEQLEQIADAFDYTISPLAIDPEILGPELEETERAWQAAHTYVPQRHKTFAEYLLKNYRLSSVDAGEFAFYDLTGDGAEDLLLGAEGKYTSYLTMEEGTVASYSVSETYLCENGVQEEVMDSAFSSFEKHTYLAPGGASAQIITCLTRKDNLWYQGPSRSVVDAAPISEEQARAVMAQYPRKALNWYPLEEFPMDSQGRTLGDDARARDDQPSDARLRQIYADLAKQRKNMEYTHFLLADFNQDGREDLWLSQNGETVYDIFTYSHGETYGLAILDCYPCEGNIMESYGTVYLIGGVEKEEHAYYQYGAEGRKPIAYVAYNKATASWECDKDGTPITEPEAMAIIAQYQRTPIGFRPIAELTG